ncbi:response regulator [Phenylobacterium hankyongense]|nr:response regulator [Phenylobacterium hankyongense]
MGRILVVEDDHAICALITDILQDAGFETRCVQTDREAYAVIPSLPTIEALILDVNLGSGTTGFDVARFARQVIPELPVIYVSGEASQTNFSAFGVPDSDFVEKPFTPDELLTTLRSRMAA